MSNSVCDAQHTGTHILNFLTPVTCIHQQQPSLSYVMSPSSSLLCTAGVCVGGVGVLHGSTSSSTFVGASGLSMASIVVVCAGVRGDGRGVGGGAARLDGDALWLGLGDGLGALWDGDGQHTVVQVGLDVVLLGADRQGEGAGEAALHALTAPGLQHTHKTHRCVCEEVCL